MVRHYGILTLFTAFAILFCYRGNCQTDYYEARQRVHIIESGSTIEAGITNRELSDPKRWRVYFSYYFDAVHQIQGAYVGRLLHGPYLEFSYPEGKLRSKGMFKNGLKHGSWTCWYPNGMIQELEHWHKGVLKGKVRHYTPEGKRLKIKHTKKKPAKNTSAKKADSAKNVFRLRIPEKLLLPLKFSPRHESKKSKQG